MDILLGVPGKLKALVDRLSATWAAKLDTLATDWTTARAAKQDNLDAAVTTRVSNAVWTDAKAAFVDAAITGRLGSIKAIYRGTITLGVNVTSATATITAVVLAKSVLTNLGVSIGGPDDANGAAAGFVRLELTNTTTITASHHSTTLAPAAVVGYQVIEFN